MPSLAFELFDFRRTAHSVVSQKPTRPTHPTKNVQNDFGKSTICTVRSQLTRLGAAMLYHVRVKSKDVARPSFVLNPESLRELCRKLCIEKDPVEIDRLEEELTTLVRERCSNVPATFRVN